VSVALPTREGLETALVAALDGYADTDVHVGARTFDPRRGSTFPTEIVTVELAGETHTVFCKYQGERKSSRYGHRGGVGYEAHVYRHVLSRLPCTIPRYYGHHSNGDTGDTYLFLEFVRPSERVSKRQTPRRFGAAARWLGEFHRETELLVKAGELGFLIVYDRNYYAGWAKRTLRYAAPVERRYPWLRTACHGFMDLLDLMLETPAPVAHGEFHGRNVLLSRDAIYPVDWESAAVAPGEIDLAFLGDGWPAEIVAAGEAEYSETRWRDGIIPATFARRLSAARMYLQLRWLGDRPEWTVADDVQWRFRRLHAAARSLDLV
jgi:hypothetical protein